MPDFHDPNRDRLRSIARLLGVPVSTFYGERPPGKLADTAECLRLWDQLHTDAQRAAALDALRKILGGEDR